MFGWLFVHFSGLGIQGCCFLSGLLGPFGIRRAYRKYHPKRWAYKSLSPLSPKHLPSSDDTGSDCGIATLTMLTLCGGTYRTTLSISRALTLCGQDYQVWNALAQLSSCVAKLLVLTDGQVTSLPLSLQSTGKCLRTSSNWLSVQAKPQALGNSSSRFMFLNPKSGAGLPPFGRFTTWWSPMTRCSSYCKYHFLCSEVVYATHDKRSQIYPSLYLVSRFAILGIRASGLSALGLWGLGFGSGG